jgi:2-keto-4-pentenoate hydratase/2-oxohepta-3-ene-1,7-dioic acid hydratase in catechol pathway
VAAAFTTFLDKSARLSLSSTKRGSVMKLLTFRHDDRIRVGVLLDAEKVVDLAEAGAAGGVGGEGGGLPGRGGDMLAIIKGGAPALAAIRSLAGEPPSAAIRRLSDLTILAPIPRPERNIFCVGRNYLAHVEEGDRVSKAETKLPEWPQFFSKPPQSVIGPNETIPHHGATTRCLDYEVELAVVIGREGRDIPESAALEHVFGVTIGNDITARDLQRRHGQWLKGKGLDRSCPLGPWIVTRDELDPTDLALSLSVNGELRQKSRTSNMIFPIPTIIAQLSAGMTLLPGDVILTGTPEGVGYAMDPPRYLQPGDHIEAIIEGVGALENTVA